MRPVMTPSVENRAWCDRWIGAIRRPMRALLSPVLDMEVHGLQHLPAEGPVLLLGNHVTAFDPYLLVLAANRSIQYLTTDTLMDHPWLGGAHRATGAIPKKRFHRDPRSVPLMAEWAAAGSVIGVFPEGERTWSGQTQPLAPGIAQLVQLLNIPVVVVQFEGAYRVWPRWSTLPRPGRISLRFLPAKRFSRSDSEASITAWIADKLEVSPHARPDLPAWSRWRAKGLSNLLCRCLACGADEALSESGNLLACEACGVCWTVDAHHRLHSSKGQTLSLEQAIEGVRSLQIGLWSAHQGPVLRTGPVTLIDRTDGLVEVGTGELVLTPTALELRDGADVRWRAPLEAIRHPNIEYQRMLELQFEGRTYRARLPTGSAWRWPWAIAYWAKRKVDQPTAASTGASPMWNHATRLSPSQPAPEAIEAGVGPSASPATSARAKPNNTRPASQQLSAESHSQRPASPTTSNRAATPPPPRTNARWTESSASNPASRKVPTEAASATSSSASPTVREAESPWSSARAANPPATTATTASVPAPAGSIAPPARPVPDPTGGRP